MDVDRPSVFSEFSLRDPKYFAEKRRALLTQTIETSAGKLNLTQFQETIDHMIAVDGVPLMTLPHLFDESPQVPWRPVGLSQAAIAA